MVSHGIGERIEETVDSGDLNQLLVLERHRFAYQEVIPHVKAKKILEIGCGTAYGTRLLAEYAAEIVALDTDSELVASLAEGQTSPATFQWYDGITLPFPDDSFDGIISFQVIEHVADDLTFLEEVKRVLKRGGRAYVTTPNRLLRLLPNQRPFNHYHVREYAPQELGILARRAGFSVRLEGIFGDAPTQALEVRRLKIYRHWLFRNLIQHLPVSLQQSFAKALKLSSFGKVGKRMRPPIRFQFYRTGKVGAGEIDQCIDLWLELEKV